MGSNLLATINWADPKVIGIVVGAVVVVAAIGYLVWAYFSKNWPFEK